MSVNQPGHSVTESPGRYVPVNSGRSYGFGEKRENRGRILSQASFPHQMQNPRFFSSDSEAVFRYAETDKLSTASVPYRNKNYEKILFDNASKQGVNFDDYDAIPVDVEGDEIEPMVSFSSLSFGDVLDLNIELCGFEKPTPIQKFAVPAILKGRDLIACAQTGSGKTAAFLAPIIKKIYEYKHNSREYLEKPKRNPLCLIIAPTRELVQQILNESKKLTYRTGIESVAVYGGEKVYEQLKRVNSGCDIIVGTPGRLIDIFDRKFTNLSNIKYLILDEADRMLDMGFEIQIRKIFEISGIPKRENRQTIMFSATFPNEIHRLASDMMNPYVFLKIGSVGSVSKNIKQEIIFVSEDEKFKYLLEVLSTVSESKAKFLVFLMKKRDVDLLEMDLFSHGFKVVSIHGDKVQRDRDEALALFKTGSANVMVATDVAQRGLDISNVTHVINYDLGYDIDNYIHRIGRTGRVGNTGIAISLFTHNNSNMASSLINILNDSKQEIPDFLYNYHSRHSYTPSRHGFSNSRDKRYFRLNSSDNFRKNVGNKYWDE